MDDAFFETVNLDTPSGKQKRGRGFTKQTKVLVMVESIPVADKGKHKTNRVMRYVKMKVIGDLKASTINYQVREAIDKEAEVITDGSTSFNEVKILVKVHAAHVVPASMAHVSLPWADTVISNAKRLLLGVHHSVRKEYLQFYLDEYCYKLNRRNMRENLFDRMLKVGANQRWY